MSVFKAPAIFYNYHLSVFCIGLCCISSFIFILLQLQHFSSALVFVSDTCSCAPQVLCSLADLLLALMGADEARPAWQYVWSAHGAVPHFAVTLRQVRGQARGCTLPLLLDRCAMVHESRDYLVVQGAEVQPWMWVQVPGFEETPTLQSPTATPPPPPPAFPPAYSAKFLLPRVHPCPAMAVARSLTCPCGIPCYGHGHIGHYINQTLQPSRPKYPPPALIPPHLAPPPPCPHAPEPQPNPEFGLYSTPPARPCPQLSSLPVMAAHQATYYAYAHAYVTAGMLWDAYLAEDPAGATPEGAASAAALGKLLLEAGSEEEPCSLLARWAGGPGGRGGGSNCRAPAASTAAAGGASVMREAEGRHYQHGMQPRGEAEEEGGGGDCC